VEGGWITNLRQTNQYADYALCQPTKTDLPVASGKAVIRRKRSAVLFLMRFESCLIGKMLTQSRT